jgi:hypothetical protein
VGNPKMRPSASASSAGEMTGTSSLFGGAPIFVSASSERVSGTCGTFKVSDGIYFYQQLGKAFSNVTTILVSVRQRCVITCHSLTSTPFTEDTPFRISSASLATWS